MKAVKYMDEEILLKRGINLLIKELGPVEALRFINISKKKRTESVKRHRQWQARLDKDKFYSQIFRS